MDYSVFSQLSVLLPGIHGIEFRTERSGKLHEDNFGPEIVLFEAASDLLHFSLVKYVSWVVWNPIDPGPWPNEAKDKRQSPRPAAAEGDGYTRYRVVFKSWYIASFS